MPLVRCAVRNEYGLGQPELYTEANKEDPKAVLDGVAVAGLVGILRQLGDLAEFAAEVFHGLQEQVMTTASRSQKLMVRVQNIEAAIPPLEKVVLAQTSHIHFAYTAGSEWHPRIQNEQNHFIYNDLPRFIMDSYEECRDPPRFHLLDKFDSGGPGSCLKRYSDPTFFKRVSGGSIEPTGEKIHRDKKARKRKKKRSSQRNGELSRGASISNHSDRMEFTSPAVNGRTSSQTASTVDMTRRSDLGDHSMSFDSRTGSGYIECVFNLDSSLEPREQESKEHSSRLMKHADTLDSSLCDEPTQMVDDSFQHSSSQEQIAPTSSCVSWDEKAEIVEPKGQQSDRDDAPEVLSTNFDVDMQDGGTANLRNVDQMDMFLADEDTPKSIPNGNQLNEIESEPDNFMDALNSIESESENDLEFQTKQPVEQSSFGVSNGRIEDGIYELMAHTSDHHLSNVESHPVSCISESNGMPCRLPNSVPTEGIVYEQTPQISGKSYESDHSLGTDFSTRADTLDGSKVESVISDGPKVESVMSDPSSSGSRISDLQAQSGNKNISSFCETPQSHAGFSGVNSVQFWTNGGLLGLEPSKPPDFAVSNALSQDYMARSKYEAAGPPNATRNGDRQKEKLDTLAENAENFQKVSSSSNGEVAVPLADSDAKFEKSSGSDNRFSHSYIDGLNETAPDTKATSNEANRDNDGNSSLMFGLGHRLLVNGFRRKLSLAHDDKYEPVSSQETGVLDQGSADHYNTHRAISEMTLREQYGHGSPLHSPTSSPPLEHMKISFNPIDGFETSKLKLKFPDGNNCDESIRDTFPSFQLVPEPAVLRDYGSDSDDDTFCRSSPYMSDDSLSHHSDSNSEQWESGDSPGGSKDQELYDALCRMSSMESAASSLQLEGTAKNSMHVDRGLQSIYTENGEEPCLSSLDLPSFDAMNPVLQEEAKTNPDPKNLLKSQNLGGPTPLPPLPPVQWRVSKPHSELREDKQYADTNSGAAEDKQYAVSEAFRHELDLKLLGSTISQQPRPASADQQSTTTEAIASKLESKEDQQKLNRRRESAQDANAKGVDEKDDFLHQIRTKSFSLRPTVTAKPTITSGPTTNVKVTAILAKANAIRQVVGSDDDDDDDNWSDT